jgi:hypothetical protein
MDKADILGRLAELSISQATYDHVPVMTSEDLANVTDAVFSPHLLFDDDIKAPASTMPGSCIMHAATPSRTGA